MATKKVRMKVSRGNPSSGVIIRAGATADLPDFWADRFIADGSAELIEENPAATKKPKTETEKPKK